MPGTVTPPQSRFGRVLPSQEVARLPITKTLELNQGNKPKTAERLGISLKTLYNKLERYEPKG